ncbi:MAG TPA: hypothetical protein VE991_03205, partial [Acidimicrobiales bacterium]|nr:hypothetical protein [Acidimicrobiales bacterium]
GYQMLGRRIVDRVESDAGTVDGLGWLDVTTVFEPTKCTRQRRGLALGATVTGYEIHHGRPTPASSDLSWITFCDDHGGEAEGASDNDGALRGTSLHGLFEHDDFRRRYLADVAVRRGKQVAMSTGSFAAARLARFDAIADAIESHVDQGALAALIAEGAP